MSSDSENDDGRHAGSEPEASAPAHWAAVNVVSPEGMQQAEQSTARRNRPQDRPATVLPEGDGGLDVPIKIHRGYGGFIALLFGVIAIGGGLFILSEDTVSFEERVPQIPFAAQRLVKQNKIEVPPPPPPPKTLVRFESTPPGAQMVVNGRILGARTPTAIQVPVDRPMSVWARLSGHRSAEQQVVAKSGGGPVSVTLGKGDLPTGSLEIISSPDGARVTLDGKAAGLTPLTLSTVPAEHGVVIRVEKEGHHPHVIFYRLEADEARTVTVRLSTDRGIRTNAVVHVKSFPLGADVVRLMPSDSKRLGRTGSRPVDFAVPQAQLVHLRATAARHEPAEHIFEIDGLEYTVLLRLKPPELTFGALTVTGDKKLTVYVDSSELDGLPVKKLKLAVGVHRLVVMEPETQKRARAEFTVTADTTVEKKIELVDGEIVIR